MPHPLRLRVGQLCFKWIAVDILVGHHMTQAGGVGDQPLGHLRRNCLAMLVETNIPLGAAHGLSQLFLAHTQLVADGFYRVHAQIIAALLIHVNSGGILRIQTLLRYSARYV